MIVSLIIFYFVHLVTNCKVDLWGGFEKLNAMNQGVGTIIFRCLHQGFECSYESQAK